MTWRDKLEIGIKKDAPYREDNLPPEQATGPKVDAGPGRSPVVKDAEMRAKSHQRRTRRARTPSRSKAS